MKTVALLALSAAVSLASLTVACGGAEDAESVGGNTSAVTGTAPAPTLDPTPAPPAPAPTLNPPSPPPAPGPGACIPLPSAGGGAGGPVGMASPAAAYCIALGGAAAGSDCSFADGTVCGQWAFYRGECGQAHSFCNRHGGSVSNVTEDMGGWTTSYARCTLGGVSCEESTFARTCTCE